MCTLYLDTFISNTYLHVYQTTFMPNPTISPNCHKAGEARGQKDELEELRLVAQNVHKPASAADCCLCPPGLAPLCLPVWTWLAIWLAGYLADWLAD